MRTCCFLSSVALQPSGEEGASGVADGPSATFPAPTTMGFSTQPTLPSTMPEALLELANSTFDGRSSFRGRVMSCLFWGLGFPRAPCCRVPGRRRPLRGGIRTPYHFLQLPCLRVLIRQMGPRIPARTRLLATAPGWLSARSLLVPRPLRAGLSTGHSRLVHIWRQPVISLSKAPEPLSPSQ